MKLSVEYLAANITLPKMYKMHLMCLGSQGSTGKTKLPAVIKNKLHNSLIISNHVSLISPLTNDGEYGDGDTELLSFSLGPDWPVRGLSALGSRATVISTLPLN